jgi:DNA-nicking Smr family endonuclease
LSNKISDKDKKDWENFLSNKSPVYNKDLETTKKNIIKSRTFDFHGFSLDEANDAIKKIIKESYDKDIRKLIIITGKGIHSDNEKDPYKSKKLGILKHSLPEYIRNNLELHPFINELKEAKVEDGGSGAFYIFLKKRK